MKPFKLFLLSSLLVSSLAIAMTSKVKEPKTVEGTSVGKYQKPGAPVDIRYTSEHVEAGEESKVHIILSSVQHVGTMKVKLNIDKKLKVVNNVNKHLSFNLASGQREYPIDLTVMAEDDGLYYVKVLVSITGKGMRAFAVPVYVGEGKRKTFNKPVQQTNSGEKISVSPAVRL